jgi:hypothetical protein
VGVLPGLEEQSTRAQILGDARVSIFDELSAPGSHFGDERAVRQNGHQHGQVVLLGCLHVFLPEGGRDVHQPGAVLGRDEIAEHDIMSGLSGGRKVNSGLYFTPFNFCL